MTKGIAKCEAETMACPCGSDRAYGSCCQPYVTGQRLAPTAEALMRSRYTAYHQGHIDYLMATHHPTQRQADQRRTIAQSVQTTTWLGLKILATHQGQPGDRHGTVEFIAYFQDPNLGQIHERSRFVQQKGRWFYGDGDLLPPVWPQRNAPCWCGSGKKYKGCHGR